MNHLTVDYEQQRNAANLLRYLRLMGYSITVSEDGQRLLVIGDLCDRIRALIRGNKADLLQLLTAARLTAAKLVRGIEC